MKIKRSQVIVGTLILLGISFFLIGFQFLTEPQKYYAHSLRHWQEADSVPGYPIAIPDTGEGDQRQFRTAEFQPDLTSLSVMERFALPIIREFQPPATTGLIRASATGLVLYTGEGLLLGHRLPDRKIVQTYYGNLTKTTVRVGDLVLRDDPIGEIESGKLIFQVRPGPGLTFQKEGPANLLDPSEFLSQFPPTGNPDPYRLLQESERTPTPIIPLVQ